MIRKKAVEGLEQSFPLKAGKHTLELSNVRVDPQDYSSKDQKRAVLEGKTLSERVRGDLTVKDAAGAVVDHAKNFMLMQLPYFTPRHTFIVDGTEYSVANQLRQKPGVYIRRRGNEELESTFNLSKGANFRVSMDAEKGLLYMQPSHTTSKIPLHPVLRALGMPQQDIAQHWGPEIAGMNRDAWKNPDKHVSKLYETLVHPSKQTATTPEEKARVLREYFDNTAMDPEVTAHTLGYPYEKASPAAILAASKKLLDVHKAAADVDDRDSLAFKTFHSVDDFVKERIGLEARAMRNKLGWKLDAAHGDLKKALPSGPFTRSMQGLLVGSSLSAVPMQINPMELLDEASRVTMLGEGAIASERAIPLEARDVHPTHFGILDPARTPESFKVGVDLRATIGAKRDDKGNLYAPVRDAKTGVATYLKASDLAKSVIAFPGEHLGAGKIVDAMAHGVVSRVTSDKVTHQLEHVADQYGPTSNLLPLVYGIQANRVLMASKHQGQALPLTHREAPLVQVASWKPGTSVEREMVKLIVPTARQAGTITKIDDDWIHITPHTEKHSSAPDGYTLSRYVDTKEGDTAHNVIDLHHEGKNVAWLASHPGTDGDYTWVKSMYVDPAHRGKGLSRVLLQNVIDDHPNAELRLRARPFRDHPTPVDALKKLYGEFGFKTYDDENRMVRPASAKHASVLEGTKLHYDTDFPLAAKTMLHNTLTVKVGDRVEKGQLLASSNFTKDGTLALGTNLRVAYMPYRGLNTNDGIVVSQGAADKLTSEHMYQHTLSRDGDAQIDREKHRTYFGSRYSKDQYDKLDEKGVVKPGMTLYKGDPVAVGIRENKVTGDALLLGKLSKSLIKPYEEVIETWNHDQPGTVVDVANTPSHVAASIRTQERLQIGDKLSNRFGNKGVIAKIIPDHQMIQDEHGRPVDLLFTSAGIVSRINPAQVIETALGKVAEKTGKPIVIPQYTPGRDNVAYAKGLLKEHGLSDKETVLDPVTGKKIPDVLVGKSYILKLFKTTDSNWAAHGAERYDYNQQPSRGGDEGAKGIGKMEFDGLVAHNARNVLREAASIKSQRNDEFWRAVQLGLPTPSPKTPFAYDKLQSMLTGAGVKVTKTGSRLALGPLTDKDVMSMSSGALKDPSKLIRAKDLRPETHGLFDPGITGGMAGTKWSHVELHEPIVNPVFEEPVRRLLGFTQKEFTDNVGKGGLWFKDALGKINIDDKLKDLVARSKKARGPELDGVVKQIKYLEALKDRDLKPQDAYVISKVPVTPPVIRPILPLKDGRLQVSDANLLYKDAFLANDQLRKSAKDLPSSELPAPRQHLYDAVSALYGVGEPVSPSAEKRGAKGYLAAITGTRPGSGFFQSKLMKRQQDVSGRATIAPDPTLSMDEIGMPEGMLWGMYSKFVIGRLVKRGYSATDAQKMVDDRVPTAREELINESRERPVFVNRAPSLHRFNIVGAYPKIIEGKTIRLNPFAEKGMNADYDGDAMQIHAPVTPGGVEDVKKMTLSHLIFADKRPGVLNIAPDMEGILGLHRATQAPSGAKTKHFESQEEAMAAYHQGAISLNDPIEIKGKRL
jgi:DNA-directed RNA polymerase beta subunit